MAFLRRFAEEFGGGDGGNGIPPSFLDMFADEAVHKISADSVLLIIVL